jgi:hypothetical protein
MFRLLVMLAKAVYDLNVFDTTLRVDSVACAQAAEWSFGRVLEWLGSV